MRRIVSLLLIGFALLGYTSSYGQATATDEKISVTERMAKARAAKAEKKRTTVAGAGAPGINKLEEAPPADYKAPVGKVLKGPNGEVVRTGERGAKYYINKNGNRTHLSSNH